MCCMGTAVTPRILGVAALPANAGRHSTERHRIQHRQDSAASNGNHGPVAESDWHSDSDCRNVLAHPPDHGDSVDRPLALRHTRDPQRFSDVKSIRTCHAILIGVVDFHKFLL